MPQAAAEAIDWYAEARGPRVIFVGKLIVSKGVDLLLAAWPLVHARHPDARLLIVGFGAAERALRERRGRARRAATSGRCASSPPPAAGSRGARTERAADALRLPRPAARPTTPSSPARRAGSVRLRRPARARRGRGPGGRLGRARLPEHLPRGVRDGRRRGGGRRRAAGLGRPLGRRRGQPRRSPPTCPSAVARPASRSSSTTDAVEAIAARLDALARRCEPGRARGGRRRAARRPSSGSGAGTGSPAACSPPPPGASTGCRGRRSD